MHNFIVPLRDPATHRLLPGVTAGDIGPKIGYNNMDNGWCRFHRVRVPRTNMPMRFSVVSREGKYTKTGHDKVGYVTMMELRALMIADCRGCLAKACTIAIRYSAVRQQGGGGGKSKRPEMAVLDYPTQQHRLFPLLASCYAFHFTGTMILDSARNLGNHLPSEHTIPAIFTVASFRYTPHHVTLGSCGSKGPGFARFRTCNALRTQGAVHWHLHRRDRGVQKVLRRARIPHIQRPT